MASRTQTRLAQLTGSLVDIKTESQHYVTPKAASALTGSDVQDILGVMAAALHRIHGAASDEPFNNTAGELNQNISIVGTNPTLTIGDGGNEDVKLKFNSAGTDFQL